MPAIIVALVLVTTIAAGIVITMPYTLPCIAVESIALHVKIP